MQFIGGWVLFSAWYGCSALSTSSPAPATALFVPTPDDTARLEKLVPDLEQRALHCTGPSVCARVHFERGMTSLFENRGAATASFRRVLAEDPSSPWAASSKLWLQWLSDEQLQATANAELRGSWRDVALRLVRDWMEVQLAERTNRERSRSRTMTSDMVAGQPDSVQALRKQVRERDRRIDELRSQLDALKAIDRDTEGTGTKIRPPVTLVPMMSISP